KSLRLCAASDQCRPALPQSWRASAAKAKTRFLSDADTGPKVFSNRAKRSGMRGRRLRQALLSSSLGRISACLRGKLKRELGPRLPALRSPASEGAPPSDKP